MSLPDIRVRRSFLGRIIRYLFYSLAMALLCISLLDHFRPALFQEPRQPQPPAVGPAVPPADFSKPAPEPIAERPPQTSSLGLVLKEPLEKKQPLLQVKPPEPPRRHKTLDFRLWRLIRYDGANPFRPFKRLRPLEPDLPKKNSKGVAVKLPSPESDFFDENNREAIPVTATGMEEGKPILMGRSAQAESVTQSRRRKGLSPEEYREIKWREDQARREAEHRRFWRRFSLGAGLTFILFATMLILSGTVGAIRRIETQSRPEDP